MSRDYGALEMRLTGEGNPQQIKFFKSRARHTAYGGARGGGKSWAMRRKLSMLGLRYENLNMLLLRRTLRELDDNHTRELERELATTGIAKYYKSDRLFEFPTGSVLSLGYCEAEQDAYRYQGADKEVIGFEEATQFSKDQMEFILTSNRSTRKDFPARAYYTCNPGGVGHAYIKRLFIDRNFDMTIIDGRIKENPDDYLFIPAKVQDNPFIYENDPGYINYLNSLPDYLRRAYLLGDWDVVKGQFFEEFQRSVHVLDPHDVFPIPEHWRRFVSMDWGYNDPWAVHWHAIGDDNRIFTYRELYLRHTLAPDMATKIKELSKGETISYYVGSPDMWQKRGLATSMGGRSVAEELMMNGIPVRQADASRVVGWQRVRQYLAVDGTGRPMLVIFPCCENLIRTFPIVPCDDTNGEDVADKCEDHALESERYALMSRPPLYVPLVENNGGRRRKTFNPLADQPRKTRGILTLG